jgi:hypothetical protein
LARESASCPHCDRSITYVRYHAGFSNEGYLYCDSDTTVLTWDAYDPNYMAIVGAKHPWMLTPAEEQLVEVALESCPNGGRFGFGNPPRCPHCSGDISFLVPDKIYFIVTGPRVKAEENGVWRGDPTARAG